MAGKSYIKTGTYNWSRIKKMYIKTGGQTWTPIRKAYIKVSETGTRWRKVYDTASNRPYIASNDIPKIRLNTFRTNSTYDPSGTANDPVNPVVEATPVQQMGPPTTTPTDGWPNGTIGNHLWGYDGNWVNPTSGGITYTYQWLYNLTGNPDDNSFDPAFSPEYSSTESASNTSSTGRADMLTNTSTYIGRSSGDYFDKNFLTFRVRATNSAGTTSAESAQVYIVRQRPSGTISMISPSEATPNTQMSASFTYSNSWYNRADLTDSYVEWFAVDNLGDTLTTLNRVQIETISNIAGVSGGSGTSYHTPTLTNKYYYARLTLNNSNTQLAAKPTWFTPNSAFTISDNKTSKTAAANGAFSLSNATKTDRFYDVSIFKRNVSVQIGQSSGADRYEVQIEGQYDGTNGAYDYGNSAWVVLQTLDAAPYVLESGRSGGILTYSTSVTNYRNYRFTARSRNGTSLNGAAYSNNGSSSSYVYVTAPNVAPSTPSISNLVSTTDTLGSYISFDISVSSQGSNIRDYYEYSLNGGTTWQQVSGYGYIVDTSGKIYGTGGSSFNLRIRSVNLDQQTGPQSNLLTGTFASPPGLPTSVIVKSFANREGTIFFTAGSNTGSVNGALGYDSVSQFDDIEGYVNVSSLSAGKIQLTGANSSSFSYTAYLLAYSGANKTGNVSTLQSYGQKVLAGGDAMSVSLGTPSIGSDNRTLNLSWTTTGSPTHYVVDLYYYDAPYSIVATKIVTTASASFNSSDGVAYSTKYYFRVTPRYEYATGVYYDASPTVSTNIQSGSNLVAPSISSVVWDGASTWTVSLNTAGGAGPYYQLWWNSTGGTPPNSQTNYDATSTTSIITESITAPSAGTTIYFWARSSNENLGTSTNSGNATAGTFSNWSSVYSYPVNNLSTPTISTATSAGSGSTLTVDVTGGGPTYQIYWLSLNSTPSNTVTPDGFSTSTTITDATGPSGAGTYYVWARSARSTSIYGSTYSSAPSIYISNWSASKSFTVSVTRTLSFNANGGTSAPSSQTGTDSGSGATITITSSTPSRTGYTFAGWNTNSSGTGTNYSSGGSITISSDTTLYAKWTANAVTRTLSFNANGGSGAPAAQTGSDSGSGATITISSTTPTRTSYTFAGWNTNSSGTGTNYSAGGSITITADTTLYAKWSASLVGNNKPQGAPSISYDSAASTTNNWAYDVTITKSTVGNPEPSYYLQWFGNGNANTYVTQTGPYTSAGLGGSFTVQNVLVPKTYTLYGCQAWATNGQTGQDISNTAMSNTA